VLRGGTLRLESPQGDVGAPPRTFAWTEIPEASSYELRIFAVDGTQLAARRVAALASATPTGLLTYELDGAEDEGVAVHFVSSVRYEWQVTALDEGGAPIATSPRSSFRMRPERRR
jgi:hypothetical protein